MELVDLKQPPHPILHLRNVHLLPFLAVALFGLFILTGWWSQQVTWVQPAVSAPPFVANAALIFLFLGLAQVLITLKQLRLGGIVAGSAALLAWLPLMEAASGLHLGWENLLTVHEQLIAGHAVGKLPHVFSLTLAITATLIARATWQPPLRRMNLILALTGSLANAHGVAALMAEAVGLTRIEFWQLHAHLGPNTATALILLGIGLLLRATPTPDGVNRNSSPRWLWLPAVVAGSTLTLLFWASLKARENSHFNQTTKLTINHIASLFSSETDDQISALSGLASRWVETESAPKLRERDIRTLLENQPSCRLIARVDALARTSAIWPAQGNEDAAAFDHTSVPLRAQALHTIRESHSVAVAGPIRSPVRPPRYAIYLPYFHEDKQAGVLAAEFEYSRTLAAIVRRLDLANRYELAVSLRDDAGTIEVYRTSATLDSADPALEQAIAFNLNGQRLTIRLTPRDRFVQTGRNPLPWVALFSGLGVSALIGLVIFLAQKARVRQRQAEAAAEELFAENEERRRVENALRASQVSARLLTHVAERTENHVFITSPAGQIQWVNDSFTRFTGHSLTEANGTPLLELISDPEGQPGAHTALTAALHSYRPLTTEVLIHNQDHSRACHLRFELQPVKNEEGLTENFIAIGTDITASVQTETILRRAKAEADAASRAKSEFLATVSHEIRTPMNGVIGMTSLLLDTPLNPEQREFVGTIRSSGQSLLNVINEILDFSNLESGRLEIEHQPFEITQCVEEAIHLHVLEAAAKNIEMACAIDPALPSWILLDHVRLRQVLANLISNAVKFTARGQITIEVNPATSAATTSALPGRHTLEFIVRDTGIGIRTEHRHRLFKPFSQVDSSNTRKYGGTGLGLAICQRLCQLMDGSIQHEDNPGGGSILRFTIQAEAALAPAPLPPVALPASWHQGKVLLVDDLPLNRLTLRHSLAALQLNTIEAGTLAEARQMATHTRLAAAIIDQDLASESGGPLIAELRAQHPELLIIEYCPPASSAQAGAALGRHHVQLPKPIRPALLLDKLAEYCRSLQPVLVAPEPPAQPITPALTSLAQQIPLRILIVEDNPVNQKVAQRFLSRLGYESSLAGNGVIALQILDEQTFDLVFMDMMMPEMDGLTATKEIRLRYPATRQPRIFALTANAITGDRERCLEVGMDDYLSKPVKIENIEQLIRKYFSKST